MLNLFKVEWVDICYLGETEKCSENGVGQQKICRFCQFCVIVYTFTVCYALQVYTSFLLRNNFVPFSVKMTHIIWFNFICKEKTVPEKWRSQQQHHTALVLITSSLLLLLFFHFELIQFTVIKWNRCKMYLMHLVWSRMVLSKCFLAVCIDQYSCFGSEHLWKMCWSSNVLKRFKPIIKLHELNWWLNASI